MANMSYCRFENTLPDLMDCLEHIEDELTSKTEQRARDALVIICREIVRLADAEEDNES